MFAADQIMGEYTGMRILCSDIFETLLTLNNSILENLNHCLS